MIHINSALPHVGVNFTEVDFTENGEPRSQEFDDVYFSDCGGMEESEHVFIGGCDLRERLRNRALSVRSSSVSDYLVGETGFGTGLNLLTLMNFHKRLQEEESLSDSGIILPHVTFLTPVFLTSKRKAASSLRLFPHKNCTPDSIHMR